MLGKICIFLIHTSSFFLSVIAYSKEEYIAPKQSEFEFKLLSIKPSGDGVTYDGKFFIHNTGGNNLRIGSDNEQGEKLMPHGFESEYLEGDKWVEVYLSTCGIPTSMYDLSPGTSAEFTINLDSFEERDSPALCRIRLWGIYSDPFVLNWDRDKKEGRFLEAKQRNLQDVRSLLIGAGFNGSMLEGDDFCDRLVRSMMNMVGEKQGNGEAFDQFVGNITRGPNVLSNGLVEILFSSEKSNKKRAVYNGWVSINPKKFSSRWFRKHFPESISVTSFNDGANFEFTDETSPWTVESSMYIRIRYDPVGREKPLDLVAARAVFVKMTGVIGTYLTPIK